MRYVAFVILVLISAYFLFVKPLLATRGIEYEIKLRDISFSPLGLDLESLYIYLPTEGAKVFLNLQDLKLTADGNLKVFLKEGSLNLIPRKRSTGEGRTFEGVPLYIPEFLRKITLRVDRFLVNYGGRRETSVLVERLKLHGGKLTGEVKVITPTLTTLIRLREVLLREGFVEVRDVRVSSELFDFSLKASLEEGSTEADFEIDGKVRRISTPQVVVEPISVSGSGKIDYEGIEADLEGRTSKVQLVGRGSFDDVRADGKLNLIFRKSLKLEGTLVGENVEADYKVKLFPKKEVSLKVHQLYVNSDLLGVKTFVDLRAEGEAVVDLENKRLELRASSEDVRVEDYTFLTAELFLDYNYYKRKGVVELSVLEPGEIRLSGRIEGKRFLGKLTLSEFPFSEREVSTLVHYDGELNFDGVLKLRGGGTLKELSYRDINLGDVSYELRLSGTYIDADFRGKGFEGRALGDPNSISAHVSLRGFSLQREGFTLTVNRGRLELSKEGERIESSFSVGDGLLEGKSVRASLKGRGWLEMGRERRGEFELLAPEVLLGEGFKVRSLKIEGRLRNGEVVGTYTSEKVLRGSFFLNTETMKLKSEGRALVKSFHFSYKFAGDTSEGLLGAQLRIKGVSRNKPLRLQAKYRNGELEIKLLPETYEYRALKLTLGGAVYRGSFKEGIIEFGNTSLTVLGEPVVELVQREGVYSEGRLDLGFSLKGSVEGGLYFLLDKGDYLLSSSGILDLDKLSFFISTPAGGPLKGTLEYSFKLDEEGLNLSLKNRGSVVSYSRYFTYPMNLWVELRALGKNLASYLTAWRGEQGVSLNVGSINLKDYYIYITSKDLPVSYRSENFHANLKVSSEGWVDVRDLKSVKLRLDALLSGEVEVLSLERKRDKKGKPPAQVELDVRFESSEPIRVSLPEGYVYAKVKGWVGGKAVDPDYALEVDLLSGELSYFGRKFFVREGEIVLLKEKETVSRKIDISIVNPSPEVSIFINLRGDLEDPDVVVWSEPPRSTQEILTKLIVGSTAESIIPVANALFRELGYVGDLRRGIANLLGIEITFSTKTGSQGELGVNINVRRKIARAFAIEYQQSTLKDPRETYYGGSITLPANTFLYGRVFSDKSSEIKLRLIRKFDF